MVLQNANLIVRLVRHARPALHSGLCFPLFFIILCFLFADPVHAADYYVSASGQDSNTGNSPTNAWRTVAKVNASDLEPGSFSSRLMEAADSK